MSTIINNHSNPDQMADLKKVLDRALNTWDDGPRWLFDLCDAMDKGQIKGVTFYTGQVVVPVPTVQIMGKTVAIQGAIDQAVNRFLGWKLPQDFSPDNGVRFSPPSFGWPTGTNLLNAQQAKAMFMHCLGITK